MPRQVTITDPLASQRILDCMPKDILDSDYARNKAIAAYEFISLLPLDKMEPLDQLLARNMKEVCYPLAAADVELAFCQISGTELPIQFLDAVVDASRKIESKSFDAVRDDELNNTILTLAYGDRINASQALIDWRDELVTAIHWMELSTTLNSGKVREKAQRDALTR